MPGYKITLDAFQKKMLDLLKKYEELNDEPFSSSIIALLRNIAVGYYSRYEKLIMKLKAPEAYYKEAFDSLTKEYNKKEKILDEKLRKEVLEIEEKYKEKKKALEDEIKEKEKEIHFEENDTLMDIEFFIMANEQNIELFEREYNENISRFNYQIQIAKESYQNNTLRYNEELEKELAILEDKHEKVLVDYDQDTERIVNHYKKNVEELNAVLAHKIDEFNKYQTQIKNQRVKESMELNDKIRDLMQIRNEKIQDAKYEYSRKQIEAQEDKESKRQEYQMESQKISKEFVLNMSALDDKISKLRDDYNQKVDHEKRTLNYKLLELKKEQEKELTAIYSTSNPSKKLVKSINQEYYNCKKLEKKNTDKTLKYLFQAYDRNLEKTNYQKKLLDLDRTYNIKYILENESYDNKKYQEINNGFENDMNLSVSLNNLDFNRQANELRKLNTLKTLKEEKEYDESDALHQIETEKLICQIKSIKYEIESFEEIQRLLHKYEDTKYQTTVNFKTVNNVLEVEKCKVLDVLNKSMYDLNVKASQMVLDTSKRSTELKNNEYEQKCKAKIQRNKLVLNTEQKLIQYQTECFIRDEKLEISVLNRNFFYELDSLGHNFLTDKFKLEYKKMMQHLSILSQFIQTLQYQSVEMIDCFYDNIVYRPEYAKIVRVFMNEYIGLMLNGCQRFTENFHSFVEDVIHERLDFEETLKYKGFYKNLENQYKEDLRLLLHKKKIIDEEFQDINNEIDNNKKMQFSLENDLDNKKRQIKPSKMGPSERNEINDLISQIKAIEVENQKFYKKSTVLNKELNHIDDQISQTNVSYSRQQDEIRKMQVTNARSYYELQKSLARHFASSFADFSLKLKNDEAINIDFQNYETNIKQRCDNYIGQLTTFLKDLYEIFHKFHDEEREAIIQSSEILNLGYQTDLEEIEEDAKAERLNAKNSYTREEALRNEEIEKFDREVILKEQSMKNAISNHENMIKLYTQSIQKEMDLANQTFYSEYYAICHNQKDVVEKQRLDMQRLANEHDINRAAIFTRFKKSKEQLKQNLDDYIISRNQILHHLPEAEKIQEKAIKEEAYKKHNELSQDYVDVKFQNQVTKKEIQRNMDLIKSAFQSKQMEIEREHKISRQREKKNSLY